MKKKTEEKKIKSPPGFLEEIQKFFNAIFFPLWSFFFCTIFFFVFSRPSLPLQLFNKMRDDLLPKEVPLIATDPFTPFLIKMELSLVLSFLCNFPLFLVSLLKYIFPALYSHEKKLILGFLPLIFLLFFGGCLFCYFFFLPFTFKFFYRFAKDLGITIFFNAAGFSSLIFTFVFTFGIVFLFPIFIFFLRYFKLLPENFFQKRLKSLFLIFLIFSAIITPDGSGITQVILAFLLLFLLLLGEFLTKIFIKRSAINKLR